MLIKAVEMCEDNDNMGRIDWMKVSEHMNGMRSSKQCERRWRIYLKPSISVNRITGTWSKDEVICCKHISMNIIVKAIIQMQYEYINNNNNLH
jgi:hypothetical protein